MKIDLGVKQENVTLTQQKGKIYIETIVIHYSHELVTPNRIVCVQRQGKQRIGNGNLSLRLTCLYTTRERKIWETATFFTLSIENFNSILLLLCINSYWLTSCHVNIKL